MRRLPCRRPPRRAREGEPGREFYRRAGPILRDFVAAKIVSGSACVATRPVFPRSARQRSPTGEPAREGQRRCFFDHHVFITLNEKLSAPARGVPVLTAT